MKFARMRYIFAFIFSVTIALAVAQPANDVCTAAQTITPDGTCVTGTTVAATDNWTNNVGCQAGLPAFSHRDVWYSFTATGSNYTGTLTAGAGWAGTMEFTLASGTCTGSFTIVGSACGASPLNINIGGLVSGTTYYFTVSNAYNGTPGPFTICSTTSNPLCSGVACTSPTVITYTTGTQACVTGCNTGLAPGPDFTGNNCYDFPNATTWYSITTGAGSASIDFSLTSAALTNPYYTVFTTTNCLTYTIISCVQGAAGSATGTTTVSPNTTYLIAVSDANAVQGSFNFCVRVNNDNSACNRNQDLTVTATSMGSALTGPFQPGEIVTFCYSVTDYTQFNCNYMAGFVPTFGDCWDPVSFNAQGRPVNITVPLAAAGVIQSVIPNPGTNACAGTAAGAWSWFPAGSVTYNNIVGSLPAGSDPGAGWYFLSSYSPQTGLCTGDPTDPDNSYGDGNYPNCGVNTLDWQVCFQLQARAVIACTNGQTDCTVKMKSYADGELGVWNNVGCTADLPSIFPATLCCTAAPTASAVAVCAGNTATLSATGCSAGTLNWYAALTGGPSLGTGNTFTTPAINGNTTYYVACTEGGCTSARTAVPVTMNAAPTVAPTASPAAICTGGSTTLAANATAGSGSISTYAWSSGPVGNVSGGVVSPATGTTYTVTVTNSNTCSATGSVAVAVNARPTVAPTASPTSICNGGSSTLAANATAGSGSVSTYAWSSGLAGNVAGGSVSPSVPTTYTVTVTNSNNCTATGSVAVNVTGGPTATPTAAPAAICNGASTTLAANATAGGGTISTYAWSSGLAGNVSGGSVSPTGNTTYTVTVTNSNNCSVSASVAVVVNALPVASINPTSASLTCNTTSVLLTAGGGTTYQWSTSVSGSSITVSTPNTYTVTATDGNNCTGSASATVSQNIVPPTATIAPASATLTCASTSATLTASGGGTYLWGAGGNTNAITVTTPNTYTVTVTSGTNGCTATASAVVNQNITPPVATVTPANATLNCTTISAVLTASGGGSYAWSNGGSNATKTVSAPNTYTVTVTDGVNGCTATASAVVSQNVTPPVASVTPASAVLNCTTTSATLTASGGGTYAWSNSANTAAITVTTPNTYTVTVTNSANGCTASASATVTQTAVPPVASINPSTFLLSCTATSTVLTATGGGTYQWSTGVGTNTITVTTPNTYTVTVTDGTSGCTATASAIVSQNIAPPVAAVNPANATLTCTNTSAVLTASGGGTYLWSSGGNNNTITVTTPNTYTVTVTDGTNGCTATASALVNQDITAPVAGVTPATATLTCTANSATLTASGGGTYSWSNGTNTAAITVSTPNTYTVTVTNPTNGCTATAGAVVNQNITPPAVSVSPTSAVLNCTAQNATLTASGGDTFVWSNGDNIAAITVSLPNTYTVTATDATNGCTATAAATVTQTAVPPVATINPAAFTLTCTTTSTSLTATGGGTYQWSTGVGTTSITVSAPNTYTVTVTDLNSGCTATASAVVSQNITPPAAAINPATATLTCASTSAVLTASGGGTYLWSTTDNSSAITVTTPNTYDVTVTDGVNGCTATASAIVNQNTTPPVASVSPATATLFCNAVTANLTAGGGGSYLWSTGEVTASITVNAANTYPVTVTDATNGCTATASATVSSIPPVTAVLAGTNVTCSGGTDGSVDLTVGGGQSPFVFLWSNSAATEDISGISAGTYTVTVTDAVSCSVTASTVITEAVALLATETHTNESCNGYSDATIDVTVTGGTSPYSYQWNDAVTTEDRSNVAPGAYSLTVSDNNLCTTNIQVVVTEPAGMTVSSTVNNPTCETIAPDGSIALTITGSTAPYSYVWSNGAQTATASQLPAGAYTVSVTDANGCSSLNSFSLTYQFAFTVEATPSVYVNLGDEAQLGYTINGNGGNISSVWSPALALSCVDCASPIATPLTTTEYTIRIQNEFGCFATSRTTVFVAPVYDIFLPSAFSPNGDGNNDVFRMYGNLKDIAYLDMQIFNRWGEKVFETNDHNFSWDGTFKSAVQTPQVFIWQLKLVWVDGHREEWRKGSITLMK